MTPQVTGAEQRRRLSGVSRSEDCCLCSRGCVYRRLLLAGSRCFLIRCISEDYESDQWPVNCAKHRTLHPSYSAPPSIHSPALLFHIQPALLSSAVPTQLCPPHQNKPLVFSPHRPPPPPPLFFFCFRRLYYSLNPSQNPPFCQVQFTDRIAAISQTLQCTDTGYVQRRGKSKHCC